VPGLPGTVRLFQALLSKPFIGAHHVMPCAFTNSPSNASTPKPPARWRSPSTFPPPKRARPSSFEPGQFLTLRAKVDNQEVRRNYSISSPRSRLNKAGELEIGIRPVEGGVCSPTGPTQPLRPAPARGHAAGWPLSRSRNSAPSTASASPPARASRPSCRSPQPRWKSSRNPSSPWSTATAACRA
jgi:hypothetical protein